jgi:L-ascorbate metabolism protein UlaG (beta-lactamase superfamily)
MPTLVPGQTASPQLESSSSFDSIRLACLIASVSLFLLAGAASAAGAADPNSIAIRWLGTNSLSVASGDTTILIDPYLSRPGRLALLFSWYRPDVNKLAPYMAEDGPAPEFRQTKAILVGHSHFDHLGDVPWFAEKTGAIVAGTLTTANIARAYGVPEKQTRVVGNGDRFSVGPFDVRVVASRHGKVMFGRVPFDGIISEPPQAPLHAVSFKMGGALGYHITHRPSGRRFYFLSSADIEPEALKRLHVEGVTADVVFATLPGRDEHYLPRVIKNLRPAIIVPVHYDDFSVPLEQAQGAWLEEARVGDLAGEVKAAADAAGLSVEVRPMKILEQALFQ